jgi:hypothetical protein
VRHSQAPPEVIAEQYLPLPQVPSQRSELKSRSDDRRDRKVRAVKVVAYGRTEE